MCICCNDGKDAIDNGHNPRRFYISKDAAAGQKKATYINPILMCLGLNCMNFLNIYHLLANDKMNFTTFLIIYHL